MLSELVSGMSSLAGWQTAILLCSYVVFSLSTWGERGKKERGRERSGISSSSSKDTNLFGLQCHPYDFI